MYTKARVTGPPQNAYSNADINSIMMRPAITLSVRTSHHIVSRMHLQITSFHHNLLAYV